MWDGKSRHFDHGSEGGVFFFFFFFFFLEGLISGGLQLSFGEDDK
jgi:hypothetical protein